MKSSPIVLLCALIGPTVFAADPTTPIPATPGAQPSAQVTGKATVTIDVNGKKETREIDLGNLRQLKLDDLVSKQGIADKPKEPAKVATWLGVGTEEPSEDVRAQLPILSGTGLLVRAVPADGPAAKAGLEKNDILIRFDDQILTNPEQLRVLVRTKKDGDTVHLAYVRKGREAAAEVRLESHPEDGVVDLGDRTMKLLTHTLLNKAGDKAKDIVSQLHIEIKSEAEKAQKPAEMRTWLGVLTEEPSNDVRAQLPAANGIGLLIREVVADSPAAQAGLKKNDVLVQLDDQILTNPDQLRKLIGNKKEGDAVHLTYLRKGEKAVQEVKLGTHAADNPADILGRTEKLILGSFSTAGTGAGGAAGVSVASRPIILQSGTSSSKDGSISFSVQSQAVPTKLGVGADVNEATQQVEKRLRDAGVSDQVIELARQAVADAMRRVVEQASRTEGGTGKAAP
jgi:S1-C subfamily serine protease